MQLGVLLKSTEQNIRTLNEYDTIYQAALLIFTKGAASVLVTNNAKASIGIVTEQDVILAIKTYKQLILEMKVTEIMNIDLLACTTDEPIDEAVRVMGQYKIRNLPIVSDGGNLSGFITLDTVAKAQLSSIIKKWG